MMDDDRDSYVRRSAREIAPPRFRLCVPENGPLAVKVSLGTNAVEGVLRCVIFVGFAAFFRHFMGEEFPEHAMVCSIVGLAFAILFLVSTGVSHYVFLLFSRRFLVVSSQWIASAVGSSDPLAAAGMSIQTRRILGIVIGVADLLSLVWFIVCGVLMACVNLTGLVASIVCAVFVLLFEGGVTIIKIRSIVHMILLRSTLETIHDEDRGDVGTQDGVSVRAQNDSYVQLAPYVQITEYLLLLACSVYAAVKQITVIVYHPTFPFVYVALVLYLIWFVATVALSVVYQVSVAKSHRSGFPPTLVNRIVSYISLFWPFVYVLIIFIEIIVYEAYAKTNEVMHDMYVRGFMSFDTFLVVVGIPAPFFWIWTKHMVLRGLGVREGMRERDGEFEEDEF